MKKLILLLVLSMSMCLAYADTQKIQLSGKNVAADTDEKSEVELQIKTLDIEIKVHGMLASTRIKFSIYNPSDTEAQADFVLPLPPHSTVTGYALDIDGEMVDGVYVEKEKARFAYNSIVSKMIDPGLLEAKGDNTFFINIYPVPENDKRIFSIEFITDMAVHPYELPLRYKGKVEEVSLSIGVGGFSKLPRIRYPRGMHSPSSQKEKAGYVVDNQWKNIDLNGTLSIQNEESGQDRVLVEKSNHGDYYFLIEDHFDKPITGQRIMPDRITLFWDASLSRAHSNKTAELKLFKRLIKSIDAKNLTVDTVVFRDQPGNSQAFRLEGNPRTLMEHLKAMHYDGASNLQAALTMPVHENSDYCLLFTDGKINYGAPDLGALPCRMYIVSSSRETNHYLEYLALQSGGDYFSLATEKPESIVQGIGAVPLQLLSSVIGSGGMVEDIYLETVKPVNNSLRVSGRLTSAEASIMLNYGTGGSITHSQVFELKQAEAANSENARLLWARNKMGALLRTAQPDHQAIIDVSRQHGILSPYTSLLVLEDPEQYVEHRIEPPASKKKWIKEYHSRIADLDEERAEHFDEVVKQWNKLVKWWQTDFSSLPKKVKNPAAPGLAPLAVEDSGRFPDANAAESLQRDSLGEVEELMVSGIRASLEEPPMGPSISVKPWNPDRLYLQELNKTTAEQYFEKYSELRQEYGQLPAYYIEVADFLRSKNLYPLSLQVLSNLTELDTSDYTIRRILGYKLLEYGEHDLAITALETVLEENSNEPQSLRDLALALIQRADKLLEKPLNKETVDAARQDYLRALDLLYDVVLNNWNEGFDGIELIALMEINRTIVKCKALGVKDFKVDKRLIRLLDVDMRVVAVWHADKVDIDLWLIEPTGETAKYDNSLTGIGGHLSNDMTSGFGPEEYLLKKSIKGKYVVKVHYYGSDAIIPTGAVKLMVDVYTNYGRKNEKKEVLTIELENKEDQYLVGEIEF